VQNKKMSSEAKRPRRKEIARTGKGLPGRKATPHKGIEDR
jgi:hypothetical protein